MIWEDVRDRLKTISSSFPAYEQESGEPPQPYCEYLAEEIEVEHEEAHKLANTIALAARGNGAMTASDFVLLAFIIGRKWGLIEAANALSSFESPGDR